MGLIAVTGASGFVGSRLCQELHKRNRDVRPLSRELMDNTLDNYVVGPIHGFTDWSGALSGVDTVIHCAAYVHQPSSTGSQMKRNYFKINRDGTLRLAEEAAKCGVRRLVFLSTVKVNGEHTSKGEPFLNSSLPNPTDPYGQSKWQAEVGLGDIAKRTGLEVVILRPPLVYGPGVKANFRYLMALIATGIPLPFAALNNRRSLLALDNLVDLIILCIDHSGAVGHTFLVSDGEDLSTTQLIRTLAEGIGKVPRLFWFPPFMLRLFAMLTGKTASIDRLLGSLQVDSRATFERLHWTPPYRSSYSLKMTGKWFADTCLLSHSHRLNLR